MSLFDPHMTPGGGGAKQKFRIFTANLQDMLNPILEHQLSTPENVFKLMNFTEKRKRRFPTLI